MKRINTNTAAVLLCALVIVASSPNVQAQRRNMGFEGTQRQLSIVRPDAMEAGGIIISDDLRIYGGIAIGGGNDTNIEARSRFVDPGAYGKVDAGAAVVVGRSTNQTALLARGSYSRHDISFRPDRYDAGVMLDHFIEVAPGLGVTVGGFYYRDDINSDPMEDLAGYYQVSRSDDQTKMFLRGRVFHRHFLLDVGGPVARITFTDLNDSFDYLRYEQSAGIIIRRNSRLAPYAEAGYGNLDYLNEINSRVLSRDADELWVIAGVRITLSDDLYLDLGGRFNNRWTDDPRIGTYSNGFFDGKLTWQLNDIISIELAVDRKIVEPFENNAVLADQTSYNAAVSIEPNSRLTFNAEAGYIRLKQVGSTSIYDEFYVETDALYQFTRHIGFYSSLIALKSTNTTISEIESRVRVEAGVKVTF